VNECQIFNPRPPIHVELALVLVRLNDSLKDLIRVPGMTQSS
jgi:hypothetical protein